MIRKAEVKDLASVTHFALLLWQNHGWDELKEEMNGVLNDEHAAVFICIDNDKFVGFAECRLRYDYVEGTSTSPVGYLEGIYVDEAYRKRGFARKLLYYCEKWAKENGCGEFASDCELNNTKSAAFHSKVGFKEVNRIICYYKKL